MSKKLCKMCNEIKAFSLFNKNKASKDGYEYKCRTCRRDFQYELKHRVVEPDKETSTHIFEERYSYALNYLIPISLDRQQAAQLARDYAIKGEEDGKC